MTDVLREKDVYLHKIFNDLKTTNMKKLFLTLMAVMTLTLVYAQVTPMVLGEKHAMLRTQNAKYVLLPV